MPGVRWLAKSATIEGNMRRFLSISVFWLTVLVAAHAQVGDVQSLKRLYDYDSKQPLDSKETLLYERDGVKVYDISYASPKGGRVTAYLVMPVAKGPFAGIIFGHWGPGNRTEFLAEAMLYAEAGTASLLVDYPWVRPAPWRKKLHNVANAEADHETYVQAVVDLRRGIDLLSARPGVDPRRLAYVGHSYGAQWGAILSTVDDRVKAVVLMGGIPERAAIYLENDDPDIIELRVNTPKEAIEKYLQVNARTDAIHYVPHAAPTPLLFQFAKYERYFNETAMKRYAQAASEPKSVKWYETGHDLNDVRALLDRADWLREKIGTGSVAQILEQKLKKR
jgi:dienelactone hydrolase